MGSQVDSYHEWIRYGRVGVSGVPSLGNSGSLDSAIKNAKKKTRAKMSKGYTEIKLATEDKISKDLDKKLEENKD
eukprot:CAMPEP_0116883652 /NCGR_PEP_ID=MMETSP0463-20121206/16217_1 /TAXON_ID=181622 /ORGANISM="Strombidinopsis sp, Strain SopsisLIS2011" /LENGTH=74 /DNA_ID=CAMNT_0004538717 /DNA_START=300 /DNA_END=524 /DNA_ORIENTATION=-